MCKPECQNGGTCTGPNTCDCSGTGYIGQMCQTGIVSVVTYHMITSCLVLLCLFVGPFVVGFVDTVYNVTEGDDGLGDISVCVTLTSPEGDIGGERIFVEVFNAPRNNPLCSALASRL